MRQYEIWWAQLPSPAGRRPVLLLTRTPGYGYLSRVLIAEITSTVRGIPQEVTVGRTEGLPRASVANLDNVHAIARQWLVDRIGQLSPKREREVKRALGYALGWPELVAIGD